MSADRRRVRLAAALWLTCGVLIWNARFDYGIQTAARRYLFEQHNHVLGRAPFTPINAAMRPAARLAAIDATRWSALVAVSGLAAVRWASRRSRQSDRA